ncbi:NAD(+) synthase [Nitrosopumilus adriaticus]|uniref:NH(3)-dependent NAD(+) synthetase n=1 Tax=Nitrosopumilus adriaticus TaxID=1580092 RepID=A0A0D5C523_9ARCH|nr:NAD(+) synthase [Nitrosopumilus adriaticus]AJW71796.1 NH(3)-dependent NAD(+) synthetase [Nitrosopumilus adriaticus]
MESILDILKIRNENETVKRICDFIKNEISEDFKKTGAVVGLSGGIDSAVTAALCERALGADKVLGIILPENESDSESVNDAENIARKYNIKTEIIDITSILNSCGVYQTKEKIIKEKFPNFNSNCKYRIAVPSNTKNSIGMPFLEILDDQNNVHKLKISSSEFLTVTAATSIKHRIRMTMLYFHAEKNNFCVIGTTNKSEYLQGYFVKYGDGGTDIEPLVNLYKSQVYQLGKFLEVTDEIISKDASPDVWSYKTNDEEFFYSVPYHIVDLILYSRENNLPVKDIQQISNLSVDEIEKLVKTQKQKQINSQHMRETPHGWVPDFT